MKILLGKYIGKIAYYCEKQELRDISIVSYIHKINKKIICAINTEKV